MTEESVVNAIDYLVKFWNRESGWLHSSVVVNTAHQKPADIAKAAAAQVRNDTGEDVSTYRVSVQDAVTGEGISEPAERE